MSIRARLFLTFLLSVLLLAGLSSYAVMVYRDGLLQVGQLHKDASSLTASTSRLRLRVERERTAWKNVLLRGNQQSSYYRYLNEYYTHERMARDEIEALRQQLQNEPELVALVETLRLAHLELGKRLRGAIRVFNASEEDAHVLADRLGANLEVNLHKMVDRITRMAEQLGETKAASLQSRFADQQRLLLALLIVIGGSAILVFLWTLDRSVGKPAEQAAFLANYDPLTTLPNRTLFQDRLQHAIDKADRDSHRVTLLFFDLDHFKGINDALGHHAGDELLQQVAQRIREILRDSDTPARLGGDEFAILIENSGDEVKDARVAQNVINAIGQPYDVGGQRVHVSVSIGITSFPNDGQNSSQLLRNADAAMYLAKQQGRGCFHFYTEALNQAAERRLALESHLRQAIETNGFELHYQPQLSLSHGQVVGAEALLRFSHAGRNVSPDEFIPVLEDTGLINTVGQWVLETACTTAAEWRKHLGRDIRMAINLSGRQLRDVDFANQVADALETTGLPSHCLEVEITESLLIEAETTGNVLQRLEGMGIRLSIDDFGTGYSSLSYLKGFAVDALKIDRSFIRDIATDSDDDAVTAAIIALSHKLGIEVIAEGVENTVQQDFLTAHGCQLAQGFLFARPMPAASFTDWVKQHSATPRPVASRPARSSHS